ncbi:MAG: MFS transporter [Clostridia bacterium]|nr:MFS transporter [Clostridia bacterium]
MKLTYKHTLFTCYLAYIVQAIVNNLTPLLYVTFRESLGISVPQITLLISVNFVTQIAVDLSSAVFVDRIGYRASALLATALAGIGLVSLGLLPMILPDAFAAVLLATVLMAIGGGLIEVVISPTVEALPGDAKAAAMSLLHSFYSWGQAGVILLSTLYFFTVGVESWPLLACLWAIVPFVCTVLFTAVPIATLCEEEKSLSFPALAKTGFFFPMLLIMVCAGASELGMAQWASYYAEISLGVNKTLGDLLGPCAFALFMGVGRLFFGMKGQKLNLEKWIIGSFMLCTFSYLLTALSPIPLLSLFGCALCGLSIALLWPGTYSLGAKWIPYGGTLMFALFAFGGDVGCTVGPGTIALFSDAVDNGFLRSFFAGFLSGEIGMKAGMLINALIPAIGAVTTLILIWKMKKKQSSLTK